MAQLTYGTRTTITITLASLATASYRESNEVDNTTARYLDVILAGKITTGTTPTAGTIYVYVWGGDGTIRAAGVSGSDAAWTAAGEDAQLRLAAIIPTDATSNHVYEFLAPLAQYFGGAMPPKWGCVVYHDTAVALNATAGNHVLAYTGVS